INDQTTASISHGLDLTHSVSPRLFYKLSARQNYFKYTDYKYEKVFDYRYIAAGAPQGDANYENGAVIEGVELGRFKQITDSYIGKVDLTWQATRSHLIEAGLQGQQSGITFGSPGFLRFTNIGGVTVLQPHIGTRPEDPKLEYYEPRQFSIYLQDRIEWRDLVLRAGARFEYFDANATLPSDLRNPANSIAGVPESHPINTDIKTSLAPRLGFSFPLSASASLHFSYGHFYQLPGLGNLYNNSNYLVLEDLQEGGVSYGVLGNPNLKPEKTVQYEFGLKQAITGKIGVDMTFFFKDIRDLLGVELISTYAAADYARFTNVDFGSVTGFTLAIDQRPIGPISTTLDYTLQFAEGNSSDPRETANRAEAGKDPRPRVIPFNWDQRHTLNATAIFSKPGNYTISTILRFGSGQPYTPQVGSGFLADLETNSGRKPDYFLVDLRAEKFFHIFNLRTSLYLRVQNLLNTHFVNGFVFNTTGSPDYTQFPETQRSSLIDPSRFYNPRRIEIGLSLESPR
ncbi:MAG: TonB-dependent receptor, partial [Calditrichia bacterium]